MKPSKNAERELLYEFLASTLVALCVLSFLVGFIACHILFGFYK